MLYWTRINWSMQMSENSRATDKKPQVNNYQTSKTMSAEIMATELNLPLLKFKMSSVMHSHVGQSEKNMENALNIVKACSPCVLLIDEIEKTLSGM